MTRTLVIGVGSPLMTDDGLGLHALERLRAETDVGPEVELLDGGTWGMNLLPYVEDAERVLLIDAIRRGGAPGALVVLERDELPLWFEARLSPHQVDMRDVLALAELRGTLPADTVAIGLEPERVELGTELSAVVHERVDVLLDAVRARLARWRAEERAGAPVLDTPPPVTEPARA